MNGRLPPESPLAGVDWIRPQQAKHLAKIGIATIEDLLAHYPRRYEDRTHFDRFPTGDCEQPVCVSGTVVKTGIQRWGRRRVFEATLQEGEGHALSATLVCRWFNAFYIQKMLATGQRLVVFGKPRLKGKRVVIDHPEFEVVEPDAEAMIHMKRIVPVHPATEGLQPRAIRSLVHRAIEESDLAALAPALPARLATLARGAALREIHFPSGIDPLAAARRQLVLEEFFRMQLVVCARRAGWQSRAGVPHAGDGRLLDRFRESLPFPLTGAQERAIREIRDDLARPAQMNRLIQGDVGSGKTVVALAAMLLVVEAGFEAALMAPTQILAEQHYLGFLRLLAPLGVKVSLRTGSRQEDSHLPLFAQPRDGGGTGGGAIVIGTHALLYESYSFSRLGLVVIDEQHKFGVLQRARLISQGEAPDVLVMTATPIPRTLAMTLYGDLSISTIDELPPGRGEIVTGIRPAGSLPRIVGFVRGQLEAGRQAYVVYPVIDESEKLEVKAAVAEHAKWGAALAPFRCGLLHGRLPADEKDAAMEQFRRGEIDVLVATSVIEVGIDVPNATVMVVENADRFGLAQLHQLRGRIGRGSHKSYCVLLPGKDGTDALERLRILEETRDGFRIADEDFKIRGPGDMLGTAQSGLPPLRLGDLRRDAGLMHLARDAAGGILAADPHLDDPRHRAFRRFLDDETQVALARVS